MKTRIVVHEREKRTSRYSPMFGPTPKMPRSYVLYKDDFDLPFVPPHGLEMVFDDGVIGIVDYFHGLDVAFRPPRYDTNSGILTVHVDVSSDGIDTLSEAGWTPCKRQT